MHILNFSHPLTASQKAKIEELTQQSIENIQNIKTHFEPQQSFIPQANELIDQIQMSSDDWQQLPILINPPSFNIIACSVLSILHGKMGYFAPVIRLRPLEGVIPPQFEVAEIINLQELRDKAREIR